jgi:hypothetical protein
MKYCKIKMAIDLLVHHSVDGVILSNDAYRITKEAGIGSRTVERAKKESNIKSGRNSANERVWIIPKDIKIIKKLPLDLRDLRPNLPIVYLNSQEQKESVMFETLESYSREETQRLDISSMKRIFIICGASKFSGKFDAFAVRVPRTLEANMTIGDAFVFCNLMRTQITVLQWQGDGFAQYFKRSDYEKFPWLMKRNVGAVEITSEDLKMLLEHPRLMLRLSGACTP